MVTHVTASDAYTDLSALNAIKVAGRADKAEGLRQVAQQFEAVFMKMMLKSMRDTTKVFSEDNYLSSSDMDFYQQNYDDQISLHLSQGKGLGLADVLFKQLMHQYKVTESKAADKPDRLVAIKDSSESGFSSPNEFVRAMFPHARKAADRLGTAPELLLAQSALETGWGRKIAQDQQGVSSRNLFGIKADSSWQGRVANTTTVEFKDGLAQRQQASFRRYESYQQSFDDYVDFMQNNPRYQTALSHVSDPKEYASQLQRAGYATDPDYGKKINDVLESNTMRQALAQINLKQP